MTPPPTPLTKTEDTTPPRPLPAMLRWLLLAFAVLCLGLGIIGIIVPGLPTTVFILLAAWAAARSSPRLYLWLWQHRLFGPMLRNWANGGKVSRHAKWSASAMMVVSGALIWWVSAPRWAAIFATLSMGCVLTWLWLRPEP